MLRASEGLDTSATCSNSVRDYYVSKVAQDQNEVAKRLTVVASLLLVPTFIVGVYGQNFTVHPRDQRLGWLGLRVVVAADRRLDHRAALVLPPKRWI